MKHVIVRGRRYFSSGKSEVVELIFAFNNIDDTEGLQKIGTFIQKRFGDNSFDLESIRPYNPKYINILE